MKIEVTKSDIESGKSVWKSICYNPIALALKRHYPNADVLVSYWHIVVGDKHYNTTLRIRQFFDKVERGIRVRPFAFDI